MSGSPIIQLGFGVPFIGLAVYIGLSHAKKSGGKGEFGMDMLFAIISIMFALGVAFWLGQDLHHFRLFD